MPFFKKISLLIRLLTVAITAVAVVSCIDYGPVEEERFSFGTESGDGVFVLNEGNFMYGNASLSYYIPSERRLENDVFIRANGMRLGDVAQSIAIRDGKAWIVVNNSGVVFVIDMDTMKVEGIVKGFGSPRYIHFVDDTKAYVTALREPQMAVFDPQTLRITGYIDTGSHFSTEQMVQHGQYVFVNCWSYDNTILVIDTETDEIIDSIEVRKQPRSMELDSNGKLWVLTDGGYSGSQYGQEAPALYRIDAASRAVEREFVFSLGDSPKDMTMNGGRDALWFINRDVWCMDVGAEELPDEPFLPYNGTLYYSLGVDPVSGEVYVGDAIDYAQRGVVYRFTPQGECVDTLRTGIIPTMFGFR